MIRKFWTAKGRKYLCVCFWKWKLIERISAEHSIFSMGFHIHIIWMLLCAADNWVEIFSFYSKRIEFYRNIKLQTNQFCLWVFAENSFCKEFLRNGNSFKLLGRIFTIFFEKRCRILLLWWSPLQLS